jgi:hypothetical protein
MAQADRPRGERRRHRHGWWRGESLLNFREGLPAPVVFVPCYCFCEQLAVALSPGSHTCQAQRVPQRNHTESRQVAIRQEASLTEYVGLRVRRLPGVAFRLALPGSIPMHL